MGRKKREAPLVNKMRSFKGIEPRFDHKGVEYRSFVIYDPLTQKPRRLKKEEVPVNIAYDTDEEADKRAQDFLKVKLAEFDSVKLKIQERLAWQGKFYDFEDLLTVFTESIKIKTPRNWQNNIYYIKHFVLPYFLGQMQKNNMNNWSLQYDTFKVWLSELQPEKSGYQKTYSISTQNHVISALNTWMKIMKEKRKVKEVEICAKHPPHLLAVRGIEDVLTIDEVIDIGTMLKEIDPTSYGMFIAMRDGGFRISEALGLSVADLYEGLPETNEHDETLEGKLVKWLKSYDLRTFGYVQLKSQVDDHQVIRKKDSYQVARAPLKGRKKISEEDARIVPVFTQDFADVITERMKICEKQWEQGIYGSEQGDYLLFDGIDYQKFHRSLYAAYDLVKEKQKKTYRKKSAHCLRHTCSTYLAGKTLGTNQVCRLVLGHKDDETTERYVHIFKALMRTQQKAFQGKKRFRA